ncbi:MAG: EamA family transporter, partial [Clostridia bacterium]|nr:EamA family transporter [Clostridia bacterium]
YLGMALVIVATFFWATHILLVSRLSGDLGPITFSAFQFALCGLLSLLGSALLERVGPAGFWDQIVAAKYPILYGGLLSVGVAYTCQVVGQRGANPTAAAILLSTEAVFGALGEVVYYRWIAPDPAFRPMSAAGWAGCAVLFIGILCSQISPASFFKRKDDNA